jgi:O-antigen ligase
MRSLPDTFDQTAVQPQQHGVNADRAISMGLLALLIFGVLAFGAVEYWSLFVIRCGAALLLLCWVVTHARHNPHVVVAPLFIPMMLWGVLVFAQYASGNTAYRYATYTEALNCVAYAILCFLAVQLFRHEASLRLFSTVMSCFGACVACLAILQEFTSRGRLYWLRVPPYGTSIYGPYVNHNHYAGLMEMLAAIPLALCLSNAVARGKRLLFGGAALVMSASIFLSGSRGGVVSFVAEVLFLAIFVRAREQRHSRQTLRHALILCVLLLALLLSLATGQVWARLSDLGRAYDNEVVGGRWAIDRDAVRMWAEKPLLGWGLGCFPTVFPQFRSFYSDLVTNQAHNDLLQVGVETGIIGFALMIAFLVLLFREGIAHAGLHRTFASAVRLATLVGCTGLLAHSITDFNLHIPANAALFFLLCGIAGRPESRLEIDDP